MDRTDRYKQRIANTNAELIDKGDEFQAALKIADDISDTRRKWFGAGTTINPLKVQANKMVAKHRREFWSLAGELYPETKVSGWVYKFDDCLFVRDGEYEDTLPGAM